MRNVAAGASGWIDDKETTAIMASSPPTPEQVVQRCLDGLVGGDIETVRDSFSEDATWSLHNDLPITAPVQGRALVVDDFLGTLAGSLFAAGSRSVEFSTLIAEGNMVALEWRVRSRNGRGDGYDNDYCGVFTVKAGKITTVREYLHWRHAAKVPSDVLPTARHLGCTHC